MLNLKGFDSNEYEELCSEYTRVKNLPKESPYRYGTWYTRVTWIAQSRLCPLSLDYEFLTPPITKEEVKEELGISQVMRYGSEVHAKIAEEAMKTRPKEAILMEEHLKPEKIAVKREVVKKLEEKKLVTLEERKIVREVVKAQGQIRKSPKLEPIELPLVSKYNGLIISGRADGVFTREGRVTGVYDNKRSKPDNVRLRLVSYRTQALLYCWMLHNITGSQSFPYILRLYYGNPQTILYQEVISKDWSNLKIKEVLNWVDSFFIQKEKATLPNGFIVDNCNGCIGSQLGCTAVKDREDLWYAEARRDNLERRGLR